MRGSHGTDLTDGIFTFRDPYINRSIFEHVENLADLEGLIGIT